MQARSVVRKPRWMWLYALVPAVLLLMWAADLIPEPGFRRVLAECGAILAVRILARAWVSANRVALTHMDESTGVASEAASPEALVSFQRRNRRIRPQLFAARARLRTVR